MGHPQTCSPIQTNNSTAHALLTNKIMPKALKAMDMKFHWLRCREAQGQYCFYWRPGTQNLADYWTKHHPASHHKAFTNTNLFKEHGKQIFCEENLINTSICGTNGSTTMNNCSKRRLMAQRQGCVELTGRTSRGKDNYPRPSQISNRILQNVILAKAHSVVQKEIRL